MPSKRKVHEYVSLETAYGIGPEESGVVSVDEAYSVPPWQRRMAEVAGEASVQIGNAKAKEDYVNDQWQDYARLWAQSRFTGQIAADLQSSDPGQRLRAETSAQIRLMDSLSPEEIAGHTEQFEQKFQSEGAFATSLREFLKRRHRIGFAYSQNLRRENADLDDEEVQKKTTDFLREQGFHSDELAGSLPAIGIAPPDDDDPYWWKATKEVAAGLPSGVVRGTADLMVSGWNLGLAIGEAATDVGERRGAASLPEPEDPYIGHERRGGMPVGIRETNVYRLFRKAHLDTMEVVAPMPRAETFPGQLAGGIGQAVPQLAAMATGAMAARKLTLAGETAAALGIKVSTIGTMFALEGAGAYNQYMQYAEEEGIDPQNASATALLGAVGYASAASALEYFGPFTAMERYIPGIKRRIVAAALLGAVEGGTEMLQGLTQEAIAYGIDLRQFTWENIQDSLQQAAMEGLIGGIVGGGVGAITFQSPIVERGPGDVIATDSEAALHQTTAMVAGMFPPGTGYAIPPGPEIAGLLPPPTETPPTEALGAESVTVEDAYQDPRTPELQELSEIGRDDAAEIEKGLTIDEMMEPRLAMADALGLDDRPWFAKLNADLLAGIEEAIQANDPTRVRDLLPRLDEALAKAEAAVALREGEAAVRTRRRKAGLEGEGMLPEAKGPQIEDVAPGQEPRPAIVEDMPPVRTTDVLYHGAAVSQEVFDGGEFFTDAPAEASAYAELAALRSVVEENSELAEIVYEVLSDEGGDDLTDLSTEQIHDIIEANDIEVTANYGKGEISEARLRFRNPVDLRPLGSSIGDVSEFWGNLHTLGLVEEIWGDLDADIQSGLERDYADSASYKFFENEGIYARAFAIGHDAIIFMDQGLGGKTTHTSYLVADPSQILPEPSNQQLTSGQPMETLDESALPNTIVPEETPEQTMARVEAGTLTEPDEIDLPPEPVSTPEEASGVDDIPDGTPEKTFLDGLVELLRTETGATPIGDAARMVAGGIEGATGEVVLVRGGIHSALLDQSASLRGTDAGRETVALLDEAESRHLQMRGQLLPLFDEALASLPMRQRRAVRNWMYAMREDGQTNWATLIEHPDRVQNIPEGVEIVLEAYRVGVLEVLGDAATAANIPQLQRQIQPDGSIEWVIAPFERAEGGRYLRLYTQEGMDLMTFQDGHHLWDAFIAWGQAHPDRNPGLDFDDPAKLRSQLEGARESGKTKKAGSLEFVRIFDELPVALKDKNGKWIPIQTRDPRSHYMGAVERQSRRIALWSSAVDMLVPRYGTIDEDTGVMGYRQPGQHPDLTDVDGLLARLRRDVATQDKDPKRAENAFNTALHNYERTNYGGYEAEFMTALGKSVTGQTLAAAHNIVMAGVLQLAPLFDITNPLRSAASVGWTGMLTGYGSALTEMLLHPRKFAAEYQAMGAVMDGHVDWSVHRDTWFSDVFKRNIPQALMAVGRFTEVRGQFVVARMFDRWVQALNNRGNLSVEEARFLEKHLRLTADQIAEISRGEMSQATRVKVIQTGVKTISGLTEASHRKGAIQNSPVGRLAIPFLSVVNSVSRGAVRHVGDMATDIGGVTNPDATAKQRKAAAGRLMRSAWRMLSFVAAIAGSGFLQRYLRRAATGKELVDPEDPESWAAILAMSIAEGGIFGPYYRLFEAAKYSNTLTELPTKLVFPLGVTIEVATAILGEGRYEDSPWDRKMSDLGAKLSPAWKAANNWIARVKYPSREAYNTSRKLVRKYNKDVRGIEPRYGTGKRNMQYLLVFEAVRDGDREALDEARKGFWESAGEKGWEEDDAIRRLKSSLSSRRPVNLNEEAREEFLKTLSDSNRGKVLEEERRFGDLMERALVPLEEEK